jgi:spermidine synthase
LSFFGTPSWLPGILLGLVILAIAGKFNAVSLGMFTGGFAASAIEVVLLICFQILYGYVYQATGVIIAVFMAGLAGGSFFGHRSARATQLMDFVRTQAGIGLFALLLPIVLNVLNKTETGDIVVHIVFVILTVLIGFLVGFEFSQGTRLLHGQFSRIASSLYGVDSIGAAVGALMCSIYFVPLLGIVRSCTVIGLVSLVGSVVGLLRGMADIQAATERGSHV